MSQPTKSNNRVACLVGCLRHRRVLAHTRLRTAKQSASTVHQRAGPSAVASSGCALNHEQIADLRNCSRSSVFSARTTRSSATSSTATGVAPTGADVAGCELRVTSSSWRSLAIVRISACKCEWHRQGIGSAQRCAAASGPHFGFRLFVER